MVQVLGVEALLIQALISCPIHHLTSAAVGTTSAITVKPQIVNADTSGVSIFVNRSMNDGNSVWQARFASSFTVQEIAQ